MINKKGFLTRDFIVAGILFSGLLALMVLSINGISNEYDSTLIINEDFSDNYNRLTEQTEKIETSRKATAGGEGLSFVGAFDAAFQSTFTVIQMIFSTLNLFGDMTESFSEDFGFDSNVIGIGFIIALSILTTIIIFTIISSTTRGKI